jgi:hypothetical protein
MPGKVQHLAPSNIGASIALCKGVYGKYYMLHCGKRAALRQPRCTAATTLHCGNHAALRRRIPDPTTDEDDRGYPTRTPPLPESPRPTDDAPPRVVEDADSESDEDAPSRSHRRSPLPDSPSDAAGGKEEPRPLPDLATPEDRPRPPPCAAWPRGSARPWRCRPPR